MSLFGPHGVSGLGRIVSGFLLPEKQSRASRIRRAPVARACSTRKLVSRHEHCYFSLLEEDTMSRVVHFEIPADDTSRAIQFYKSVFDWDIQKTQMPMEYYLATTGKQGTMGINGAIMDRKE